MTSVVILFIVFVLCLVGYGIVVPMLRQHRKATAGIRNYDSMMTRYVYKVYCGKDEIVRLLEIQNINDEVTFHFNDDHSAVTVREPGASQEYSCIMTEYEEYTILRLEKAHFLGAQSYIQYKLNPCIIRKLSAEPVPFSEYGF
ncbi:MAG: hypothetical protein IJQ45_04995 [Clostridia bacterium]|nr:hypothetical protein [Clostridia bacterium]